MSVLRTCDRCGGSWETGLGPAEWNICPQCRRVEERLADGGRDLSGEERAAAADFLGGLVREDGLPVIVDEVVGGLVIGVENEVVDMKTFDGRERTALGGVGA